MMLILTLTGGKNQLGNEEIELIRIYSLPPEEAYT